MNEESIEFEQECPIDYGNITLNTAYIARSEDKGKYFYRWYSKKGLENLIQWKDPITRYTNFQVRALKELPDEQIKLFYKIDNSESPPKYNLIEIVGDEINNQSDLVKKILKENDKWGGKEKFHKEPNSHQHYPQQSLTEPGESEIILSNDWIRDLFNQLVRTNVNNDFSLLLQFYDKAIDMIDLDFEHTNSFEKKLRSILGIDESRDPPLIAFPFLIIGRAITLGMLMPYWSVITLFAIFVNTVELLKLPYSQIMILVNFVFSNQSFNDFAHESKQLWDIAAKRVLLLYGIPLAIPAALLASTVGLITQLSGLLLLKTCQAADGLYNLIFRRRQTEAQAEPAAQALVNDNLELIDNLKDVAQLNSILVAYNNSSSGLFTRKSNISRELITQINTLNTAAEQSSQDNNNLVGVHENLKEYYANPDNKGRRLHNCIEQRLKHFTTVNLTPASENQAPDSSNMPRM